MAITLNWIENNKFKNKFNNNYNKINKINNLMHKYGEDENYIEKKIDNCDGIGGGRPRIENKKYDNGIGGGRPRIENKKYGNGNWNDCCENNKNGICGGCLCIGGGAPPRIYIENDKNDVNYIKNDKNDKKGVKIIINNNNNNNTKIPKKCKWIIKGLCCPYGQNCHFMH